MQKFLLKADDIDVHVFLEDTEEIPRKNKRQQQSNAVRELLWRSARSLYGEVANEWSLRAWDDGKPYLHGDGEPPSCSLSHSYRKVACALGRARRLGVDIEYMKPRNWEQVADLVFHPIEQRFLLELSDPERLWRGYDLWVLKEATLKALGCGNTLSMCQFAFSLEPGPSLLAGFDSIGEGFNFHLIRCEDQFALAAAWQR